MTSPPWHSLRRALGPLAVLLGGGLVVLGVEVAVRRGNQLPASANDGAAAAPLLLTVLAVAALIALLEALTLRRLLALALVGLGAGALAFVHVRKVQLLDRPLLPWELSQARQILSLFPTVASPVEWLAGAVAALACLAGVAWLAVRGPRRTARPAARVGVAAVALAYLASLVLYRSAPLAAKTLAGLGVENITWDQRLNVQRNGVLLPLLLNAELAVRPSRPPPEEVASALPVGSPGSRPEAPSRDVILYLAESAWDPTRLPGLSLSRDPMPFVRSLGSRARTVGLVSPVYGGGTSEVEFEVLTGLPIAALPDGVVPYHHLASPVPSLASAFREQGLRTLAVHDWHGWFWMRRSVFPLLGFDRYVALEDMPGLPFVGPYPDDEGMVDRLLEEVQSSPQPVFAFAISMVSHGPYAYPTRPDAEVRVVDGALTPDVRREVENHASALYRSDRAFERLLRGVEQSGRPTLVVHFGDHLPCLGKQYAAYRELGFVSGDPAGWTLEERERMGETRVTFWGGEELGPLPERIGASHLGALVLRAAGVPRQDVFALSDELLPHLPVVGRVFVRTAQGLRRAEELTADERRELRRLQVLAQDRVFRGQ